MRTAALSGRPVLPLVAGAVVVVVAALLIGLVAASGFRLGEMLIAGLLVGGLMLLLPLPALIVLLLVVTLVVQGLLTYFGRFQQAAWLPYLLCMLLAVRALQGVPAAPALPGPASRGPWSSAPVLFLLLYAASLAVATLLNLPPMVQVVIGLKNALPLWIAAALVYQAAARPDFEPLFWRVLRAVFFLQLPIVLYQHFVIVPGRRHAATAMDAVVGSFGGLIDGGGASSTLVVFCLLVMAYQLALWARGQTGTGSMLAYWGVGLAIILSGEVKAALLWLPLTLFWVLRRRVFANFGTAVVTLVVGAALVGVIFTAYKALYWKSFDRGSNTELVEKMAYFFDTRNIDYVSGEVGRGASLALWATDRRNDLPHRLVGHGPAASRVSATGGLGEVARRFAPLSIAQTGVSLLLWDVGLVGLAAFLGILVSLAAMLARQSGDAALSPRQRAAADALAATMLILLSMLAYNRSLQDEPSVQLMLALCLGFALHGRRLAGPVHPAGPGAGRRR